MPASPSAAGWPTPEAPRLRRSRTKGRETAVKIGEAPQAVSRRWTIKVLEADEQQSKHQENDKPRPCNNKQCGFPSRKAALLLSNGEQDQQYEQDGADKNDHTLSIVIVCGTSRSSRPKSTLRQNRSADCRNSLQTSTREPAPERSAADFLPRTPTGRRFASGLPARPWSAYRVDGRLFADTLRPVSVGAGVTGRWGRRGRDDTCWRRTPAAWSRDGRSPRLPR